MTRLATIELHRDDLSFAAGHFTIFSATERETLHGHNYTVYTAITTAVDHEGLMFDYRFYKNKIREICKSLNLKFILPLNSPHLKIETIDEFIYAHFNQEKIPFLKKDVSLLPIANATVEEISHWFLQQLIANTNELKEHAVQKITLKVFSSPGQCGTSTWENQQ